MFRAISIAGQSHGNGCLKNEVVIFAIFFYCFLFSNSNANDCRIASARGPSVSRNVLIFSISSEMA